MMQSTQTDFKMTCSDSAGRRWKRLLVLLPALVAALLVFFPFDWLGDVWPAYEFVFKRVFATVLAHEMGHATVFFLAGTLLLFSWRGLQRRPGLYFLVMVAGAAGEELLQSLFKQSLPTIWDSRDLLLDLVGFVLAFGLGLVLTWCWRARSSHAED